MDTHRELGSVESFFTSLTRVGLFDNFSTVVQLQKPLYKSPLLTRTLHDILAKNPFLLCNVFGTRIKTISSLQLQDLVQYWHSDDESLEKTFAKLNKYRFEYNTEEGVLFKIFIIKGNHVAFVFDHSIYDGMSSLHFLKLFLSTLNSRVLLANEDVLHHPNTNNYPLPPPIEKMVNYIGPLTPPTEQQKLAVYKSSKLYRDNDHIFKILNLSTQESTKVKQICKSHNVTMTPYIQTCFLVAQSRILGIEKDKYNEITFGIDTRRYIRPEFKDQNTKFGCNVSGHFINLPSSESFSWDEVTRESAKLKKTTLDGSILFPFGAFVINSKVDWDLVHRENSILNGKNTRGNLMITNLGYTDFKQGNDDEFVLQRVYFVQSTANLGFMFSTNIVSDVHGMSIVNSMVQNDEFTETQFELIMKEFKKILLDPLME